MSSNPARNEMIRLPLRVAPGHSAVVAELPDLAMMKTRYNNFNVFLGTYHLDVVFLHQDGNLPFVGQYCSFEETTWTSTLMRRNNAEELERMDIRDFTVSSDVQPH